MNNYSCICKNLKVIHSIDLSPTSLSMIKDKQFNESSKNECKTKEDYSISINATVLLRPKLNSNNVQEYKMNESKSLDAIMSLIDKNNENNKSIELSDDSLMKTNEEQLNSLNNNNNSNATASGSNNTLMKSSSSNSSSKTGSNKNSLHGSIETMIEVS